MYSPEKYPTDYELAETNFHAIVATCRSVIHGTAVFRSFAEFSSTWHDESERKRNAGKYKIPKESRPDATKALIDRMIHVLKASGMQSKDARKKAKELILDKKEETPNVTIQDTLTEGSSSIRQAEQPETADDRLGHHL